MTDNIHHDDDTIIHTEPTATGKCSECGLDIDAKHWANFCQCPACLKKIIDAPHVDNNVKLIRDEPIQCVCGCNEWQVYYDRMACKKCGYWGNIDARGMMKEIDKERTKHGRLAQYSK